MSYTTVSLIGQRFHRLTVIKAHPVRHRGKERQWICRCDCGKLTIPLTTDKLRRGNTKSCGCLKLEVTAARNRTHGMSKTAVYRIWCLMRARCGDAANQDYADYGGRGITVCKRWQNSFEAFRDDVGPRPSVKHEIDRINNDGNYEPGNVRWATRKQQCNNKRSNRRLTLRGETLTIQQWADRTGLPFRRIWTRIARGWTIEQALTRPMRQTKQTTPIRLRT